MVRHQLDLGIVRRARTDTLHVDRSGRVAPSEGEAAGHALDFTVHFPANAPRLAVGFTWSDTTSSGVTGSVGPESPRHEFRVTRRLHVNRVLDTAGAHIVEIVSEGTVHYSDTWWADSGAHSYTWLDVTGPTHEVYWFDPARGLMMGAAGR